MGQPVRCGVSRTPPMWICSRAVYRSIFPGNPRLLKNNNTMRTATCLIYQQTHINPIFRGVITQNPITRPSVMHRYRYPRYCFAFVVSGSAIISDMFPRTRRISCGAACTSKFPSPLLAICASEKFLLLCMHVRIYATTYSFVCERMAVPCYGFVCVSAYGWLCKIYSVILVNRWGGSHWGRRCYLCSWGA